MKLLVFGCLALLHVAVGIWSYRRGWHVFSMLNGGCVSLLVYVTLLSG